MTSSPEGRQEAAVLDAKALEVGAEAILALWRAQGVNDCSSYDLAKAAIPAYLSALPAPVAAVAPSAFVDRRGELTVPDGSPLAEMLKALPNAPFGEEVLPLFIAHPPTGAGVSEAATAVCDAFDVLSLSEAYGGSGATSVSSRDLTALDRAVKALRAALSTAIPAVDGMPAGMVLDRIIEKCRTMIRERDDHEARGQGVITGLLYAIQFIEEEKQWCSPPASTAGKG